MSPSAGRMYLVRVDDEVFGRRRYVDYISKFPIFWQISATEMADR
jgi:hypothetical protein